MVLEAKEHDRELHVWIGICGTQDSSGNEQRATIQVTDIWDIGIEGPTNGFCDNQSVVTNVINPESLHPRKGIIQCVAAKALRI
jgi:hypothetical protein